MNNPVILQPVSIKARFSQDGEMLRINSSHKAGFVVSVLGVERWAVGHLPNPRHTMMRWKAPCLGASWSDSYTSGQGSTER